MLTPDVDAERAKCQAFLETFVPAGADDSAKPKYVELLQEIANREQTQLLIDMDDVAELFTVTEPEFLTAVEGNSQRYSSLFAEAADALLPAATTEDFELDKMDNFVEKSKGLEVPAALTRRFQVSFKPRSTAIPLPLRAVNAHHVGNLVKVRGVVTQVTDVKPLMRVATYVDELSGSRYYQEVSGRFFKPLREIPSQPGGLPGPKSQLLLETHNSKFIKHQEIKLQERADEVPAGQTPRTLKIRANGLLTRSVKPGDSVVVSGIYLIEPFHGFKALRAGLAASPSLEAQSIVHDKVSYTEIDVSEEEVREIQELAQQGCIYSRLARSIAPEIFGHEDIKKVLLLSMVGGVNKEMSDGMKLRGDIHVCLMGDPGVAKSQLIKYIANISPRAVYTTGKGSSGVGLTAAIARDDVTKEIALEAGALVLADRGICCIDEFDKMDESDRTAIHEVMEQQTVSIAKAGLTTMLNARTTIVSAANPAWGRYDTRKTPSDNIAMPAALLSRFDILWLILDKPVQEKDHALAKHVLAVHSESKPPQAEEDFQPLTPKQLRAYISLARQYEPTCPPHLADYIATIYANLREENKDPEKAHLYTTPRTLMSIMRLCQSLAKLQFRNEITQDNVEEALRLMKMSKISLTEDTRRGTYQDHISAIYRKMSDYKNLHSEVVENGLSYMQIQRICTGITGRGRRPLLDLIKECVEEYSKVGILTEHESEDGQRRVYFLTNPQTQ